MDASIGIGAFISAVINFIIMAFVLFCIVKAMNQLMALGHKEEEPAPEAPKGPPRRKSCWPTSWLSCAPATRTRLP